MLYPLAMEQAARSIVGSAAEIIRTPNNILGIEYLRALKKFGSKIIPVTMKRLATDHDSDLLTERLHRPRIFAICSLPVGLTVPCAIFLKELLRCSLGNSKRGRPIGLHMIDKPVLSYIRRLEPADFEDFRC